MDLISEMTVTCRKAVRCMNCLQPINRGEQKTISFMKDGRDVWSWISHPDCNSAASEFWDEPWWEGIPPLHEQINEDQPIEDYNDGYPEVAARLRLTFAGK